MNIFRVFLTGLLFSFLFETVRAQDSSLIKINYGFSYDRHNYSKASYGRNWVKPGFCYSNRIGVMLNYYFLKRKRLGLGLQVFGGNKKMELTSDYVQIIKQHRIQIRMKPERTTILNMIIGRLEVI